MNAELNQQRLVDDVMRQWPSSTKVFLKHRLHCVGCPIGRLHTIEEACSEHHVDLDLFMADLQATTAALPAVGDRQSPDAPSAIISSL
jgi:hybrid cluster-associated redox disulfide protein